MLLESSLVLLFLNLHQKDFRLLSCEDIPQQHSQHLLETLPGTTSTDGQAQPIFQHPGGGGQPCSAFPALDDFIRRQVNKGGVQGSVRYALSLTR